MKKTSRIYVANHEDMVGAAIIRELTNQGYENIITCSKRELDLTDEEAIDKFFTEKKPEYVFCFAGSHGGIVKNSTFPADIIYNVLKTQTAILHCAYTHEVKKLLFLVGSCIYPKFTKQPILEDYFMSGKMESTSVAYSTARAAGVEMCRAYNQQYGTNFVPAVMANYYGIGDDYTQNGHVAASVMHKIYMAKETRESELILWGTGTPKRQFIYSEELARACVMIMTQYNCTDMINIAGDNEVSIKELVDMLCEIIGYNGKITFDSDKPDGTPRKFLDSTKLKKLGFTENIMLNEGLRLLYQDYLNHKIKSFDIKGVKK